MAERTLAARSYGGPGDRMRAASLSDERIAFHTEMNATALDGELVRGLDRPAPHGTRWHFVGR